MFAFNITVSVFSLFLLSGTFCRHFLQLTPGEGHDRLRRVDSNRKSRSFSKQPSTGDYYKNLSKDSAEPRGSRGMAPNEEVRGPSSGLPEQSSYFMLQQLLLLVGVMFPALIVRACTCMVSHS